MVHYHIPIKSLGFSVRSNFHHMVFPANFTIKDKHSQNHSYLIKNYQIACHMTHRDSLHASLGLQHSKCQDKTHNAAASSGLPHYPVVSCPSTCITRWSKATRRGVPCIMMYMVYENDFVLARKT